jgi:demethylmenaquinone methyltransferase/2-methoxy-6-polyprenyl-1,4-benzoquinol methylase
MNQGRRLTDISKTPRRIAGMFDAIADRYDFLNHFLSAGIDRRWRRRAIRSLSLTGRERLLDICTGTADLALEAARAQPSAAEIVGVDFARAMLQVGYQKIVAERFNDRICLIRGDATRLPIASASVDAITVAFGIRNVEDPNAACQEMSRVLVPLGRVAILEFAIPTTRGVRGAYLWYFNHLLPRLGRLISRDSAAYGYLPESVSTFASPDEFVTILRQHGFGQVSAVPLTFGIVFLYTARKGGGPDPPATGLC